MSIEKVRVLRVIEYVGPRKWVEATLARSIHGTMKFYPEGGPAEIRAATVDQFPGVLGPELEKEEDATYQQRLPSRVPPGCAIPE